MEIMKKYLPTHHLLGNPKIFQDTSNEMDEVFKQRHDPFWSSAPSVKLMNTLMQEDQRHDMSFNSETMNNPCEPNWIMQNDQMLKLQNIYTIKKYMHLIIT